MFAWGFGAQATIFNAAEQDTVEHGVASECVVCLCSDEYILQPGSEKSLIIRETCLKSRQCDGSATNKYHSSL